MPRLVPGLALEPPPGYVEFVATHLEPLREQAATVVGGEDDADQLYPEVLTDVATRWRWLELWRHWLRRPTAAETYLHRAFLRRSRRWRAARVAERQELPEWPVVEVEVWTAVRPPWVPRPAWSSGATRLAAFVRPAPTDAGAIAEAAIAWWHAYEAHRRRRLYALLVALFLIGTLIWRITEAVAP
jgi:hypothetical protein